MIPDQFLAIPLFLKDRSFRNITIFVKGSGKAELERQNVVNFFLFFSPCFQKITVADSGIK